jgi:hypothetical protein
MASNPHVTVVFTGEELRSRSRNDKHTLLERLLTETASVVSLHGIIHPVIWVWIETLQANIVEAVVASLAILSPFHYF